MHRRGPSSKSDVITRVQLKRLANSILEKSQRELAEIATANPAIYHEWIDEIGRLNDEARQEAQMMSKALSCLLQAPRGDEAAA